MATVPSIARAGDVARAWVAVAGWTLVVYTHVGYPVLITMAARRRRRRRDLAPLLTKVPSSKRRCPSLTVVIPAYNEDQVITAKVRDTYAQEYPRHRLHVIVVADGSTDRTAELAARAGAEVLFQPVRGGKSAAVNRGVAAAHSAIVCCTDANCFLDPGTLRAIVGPLQQPDVGVVGGVKRVVGPGARGHGEGLYWRIENHVKACESVFGCVMGVVGELCAFNRSVFEAIPNDVINDDFYLSSRALLAGFRVEQVTTAVAVEEVSESVRQEFERRCRIAAGTWQGIFRSLQLADPRRGWTAVAFVSHRLLRSVGVPVLLPLLLVLPVPPRRSVARFCRVGQVLFYGAGIFGLWSDRRWSAVPFQFMLTNTATATGGLRYLRGRQPVQWQRVRGTRPGPSR